jgi:hypothetical protein
MAPTNFDAGDLDAAYAALDERYAAAAADDERRAAVTRTFSAAFAQRDWDTLATVLAPDLVVTDHRLLGWEVLHGRAAYVRALRSLVELAPDVRLRIDHIRMASPKFLYLTTWIGTREGGSFEAPSAIVCEIDAAGRIRRFDQYDLDHLDEAKAQLESVAPRARHDLPRDPAEAATDVDLLCIPPNAATRAIDRYMALADAADWEALRALCAPIKFDDRRRFNRIAGDSAMAVANARLIQESGTRVARASLATAGDRLVLEHMLWTGTFEGGFEVEALQVTEVDADGHLIAGVVFDPSDRRAASVEMRERFARSDYARTIPPELFEMARAIEARDPERMRAALPDDFVIHDHRRTGLGRIEGAANYVASLLAFFQDSPDVTTEDLYQLVHIGGRGSLSIARTFGTHTEGGAFESVYVRLQYHPRGRWIRSELFELEDYDLARARFEELCQDAAHVEPRHGEV